MAKSYSGFTTPEQSKMDLKTLQEARKLRMQQVIARQQQSQAAPLNNALDDPKTTDADILDAAAEQKEASPGMGAAQGANMISQTAGDQGGSVGVGRAALAGGVSGASIGSMFGPGYGTAIGAGVGAAVGTTGALLKQRATRKKEKREAQATHFENLANIEAQTEAKRQVAMTNMVSALRSAFMG